MRPRLSIPPLLIVALLLGSAPLAPAQNTGQTVPLPRQGKKSKAAKEEVEWLWQYSPPPAEGRENDLIRDPHFRPFLERYFPAPQAFWGPIKASPNAPRRSLPDTITDFLSVPGKVSADENRYITITGCVFHFCPARGLLWTDLNNPNPLVIFAAIDWTTENRTPSDPAAEYTLWIFANHRLTVDPTVNFDLGAHDTAVPANAASLPDTVPASFRRSLTRWTAEPTSGTQIHQRITTVVLVDPDGTPHTVTPASLGIAEPTAENEPSK